MKEPSTPRHAFKTRTENNDLQHSSPRFQRKTRLEQTRLIYRNYPFTVSVNFGMNLRVAQVLWQHLPSPLLYGWLLLNLALSVKGTFDYRRYRKTLDAATPGTDTADAALRHFAVVACTTGCLWGITGMTPFLAHYSLVQELILPLPGMVQSALLLALWLIAFMPLAWSELLLFAAVNLFYAGDDIDAVTRGVFFFAHSDVAGLPYWEYGMWEFYVMLLHRLRSPDAPVSPLRLAPFVLPPTTSIQADCSRPALAARDA